MHVSAAPQRAAVWRLRAHRLVNSANRHGMERYMLNDSGVSWSLLGLHMSHETGLESIHDIFLVTTLATHM